MAKTQIEVHWEREKEKKEQVINFIILMMEEYNIDSEDLR